MARIPGAELRGSLGGGINQSLVLPGPALSCSSCKPQLPHWVLPPCLSLRPHAQLTSQAPPWSTLRMRVLRLPRASESLRELANSRSRAPPQILLL